MKKLGIVIPHYKGKEQLKKCKSAIKEQTFQDIKTHVVDNNKENRGFTKGCNDGIRTIWNFVSEYFILLNQDCYLKKDAIENIVKFMDENPKCAIGGIKQLRYGKEDFIVHGGCTEAFPGGRHISGSVKAQQCTENKQMPWINGACMIVRKSSIIDFGLMDENYFLISSDADWCYTARDRGWEVWYIADAECLHEEGISVKIQDEKTASIMRLDVTHFRDKWITDDTYRELAMEIFN